MISAIKKILDPSVKVLKRADKIADEVIALEPHMQQLTDEQLQNKTLEFKERIEKGESLDDLLVEAFAVVREASTRVLGMKPYKVQIIGGCPGNTLGVSKLCLGRSVDEVISLLEGVRCGMRSTSCPDQLAKALKKLKEVE